MTGLIRPVPRWKHAATLLVATTCMTELLPQLLLAQNKGYFPCLELGAPCDRCHAFHNRQAQGCIVVLLCMRHCVGAHVGVEGSLVINT
jgi:hypothetical protein